MKRLCGIFALCVAILMLFSGTSLANPPAWKPYSGTTIYPSTSSRPNIYVPGTVRMKEFTVSTLPSVLQTVDAGTLALISDGDGVDDCTTGGGTDRVICRWTGSAWANAGDGQAAGSALVDLDDLPGDDQPNDLVDHDLLQQAAQDCLSSAPGTPFSGQTVCADGDNWQPGGTKQGTNDWLVVYRSSDTTWLGIYDYTAGQHLTNNDPVAIFEGADLDDTSSPHDLLTSELEGTIISNGDATGAEAYNAPARTAGWNVEYKVEAAYAMTITPNGSEQWWLNGTQGTGGQTITCTGTVPASMVCDSTDRGVYCESKYSECAFD